MTVTAISGLKVEGAQKLLRSGETAHPDTKTVNKTKGKTIFNTPWLKVLKIVALSHLVIKIGNVIKIKLTERKLYYG